MPRHGTALSLFAIVALANAFEAQGGSFTLLSAAVTLRPSEIHNKPTTPVTLPAQVVAEFADSSSTMFITNYSFDIVAFSDSGEEYQVPLYDVYNHHYILYMGSNESMKEIYQYMQGHDPVGGEPCWHSPNKTSQLGAEAPCKLDGMASAAECLSLLKTTNPKASAASFGGASGGEFRDNAHHFPAPFGIGVPDPQSMMPVLHFINTINSTSHASSGQPSVSDWIQCPCTNERHFDYENNTIDGCVPSPKFSCNSFLEENHNIGCRLDTYTSGYRCCENGVFLNGESHTSLRLPAVTVYAKITFQYKSMPNIPTGIAPALAQITLDATADTAVSGGSGGNIEYTVPACRPGIPPQECAHEISSVQQPFRGWNSSLYGSDIEIVHAMGHVHSGAISLKLFDDRTGQMLCDAGIKYGTSDTAGDEGGYVVGIRPCVFDPPLRIKVDSKFRTAATYNNTEEIGGVMALWFLMYVVPQSSMVQAVD